jgi:iron-sulfur cluster insertion protein
MITLTTEAISKLKELKEEMNDPDVFFRVFVQGGGCNGLSYSFCYDNEKSEDDFELFFDSLQVRIDSMSMQYLSGATIKYIEEISGSYFSVDNPNAVTSCSCGSSFSAF